VIQWHIESAIMNILKCQIGLHHCDGLVETIEMNILLDYFGVGMKEIWQITEERK
jgi:hypothetical protein